MKPINWNVSNEDGRKIRLIVERAHTMAQIHNVDYRKMDCEMDLTACHANGCPLDLGRLASARDFDFAHDVFGIRRHISRETGRLENCFVPRFAAGSSNGKTMGRPSVAA